MYACSMWHCDHVNCEILMSCVIVLQFVADYCVFAACGTVIGSGSTGQCFTYTGTKQACTLSGTNYEFFEFDYGSGVS